MSLPQDPGRRFPVHPEHRKFLKDIPWSLLAPHADRVRRYHGQSLERLAERGGLLLDEIAAILEDRPWRWMNKADLIAVIRTAEHALELGRGRPT